MRRGIELDGEERVSNKQTFPRPKSPVFLEGYGKKGCFRSKSALNHKEFEEKKTFSEKLLNLQKSKKIYKNKIDFNQLKSKINNDGVEQQGSLTECKQRKDSQDHVVCAPRREETDKNKISINKSEETSCSEKSSKFKFGRPFSAGVNSVDKNCRGVKLSYSSPEDNNKFNLKINNENDDKEKNEKTPGKQKHRFGINSRTRPFPAYGCF